MSSDPVITDRNHRSSCSGCLFPALGGIVLFVLLLVAIGLLLFTLGWASWWQQDSDSKERWERQVADVEAGRTTCLIWPEPRFLEDFVRDQPEIAAKITRVDFCIGTVSDERFGYLKRCPHLETIYFYEVWEGADAFLAKLAGMASIKDLAFAQTGLSDGGVHAVASFPNLTRLRIDYYWKGADLKPLRGHKSIETLALDHVPLTKEWIEVIGSWPKLREVAIQGPGAISKSDLQHLREALPNVKIR